MFYKSSFLKATAVVLSILTVLVTGPYSLAEVAGESSIGSIVTAGKVVVGNSAASTGTTLFAGDHVTAMETPALIVLNSGSRVEMTQAAATFSRQGNLLVVQAAQGLLRFNFYKGEAVQIIAGKFRFVAAGSDTPHTGVLGVNRNGQVAIDTLEGKFDAVNTASGKNFEVPSWATFIATDQTGTGTVTKGQKTVTDTSKTWTPNELKGQCIVAGAEAFAILANTEHSFTIKGKFKDDGNLDYKILPCNASDLEKAGASSEAAASAAAAGTSVGGTAGAAAGTIAGISTKTALIIGGVAMAGVGLGVGIHEATKSPSTRK